MSMIQSDLLLGQEGGAGYVVQRSVRFNASDSAYLSRTPASAGNRKTWTWAGWVKNAGKSGTKMFFAEPNSSTWIFFQDNQLYADLNGSGNRCVTASVQRDPCAWYHIVWQVDTTQATSSNRNRIYVNGILQTLSSSAYPAQNTDTGINSTDTHFLGSGSGGAYHFDGYLADVHFIDGQALDPSSFVETSATTGQLIPKQYTGSFGTNGFWLKFSDNSAATATTLGKDYSGNSNNWTPNNLSVSTGSVASPTRFTWNTAGSGWTLNNSNYTATSSLSNTYSRVTTAALDGGTTYRFVLRQSPADGIGGWFFADTTSVSNTHPDELGGNSLGMRVAESTIGTYGTFATANGTSSGQDQITGLSSISASNGNTTYSEWVVNMTARKVWIRNFGDSTWLKGGDPSNTSSTPTFSLPSGTIHFGYVGYNGSGTVSLDTSVPSIAAGNDSLVDTPTSYGTDTGVGAEVRGNYCTWNPLVYSSGLSNGNLDVAANQARGTQNVFDYQCYWEITSTGGNTDAGVQKADGTSNTITIASGKTYGFRTGSRSVQYINITDAGSWTTWLTSANVGSTEPYFPYVTGGAGATSILNAGQRAFAATAPSGYKALCDTSLPAPVVAKPSTVMDVKTYTGNGSTQTISGLGFSPDLVWVKGRSAAWNHTLTDTVRGDFLQLYTNTTDAEEGPYSNYISIGSSSFSVGNGAYVNTNNSTYVAWTWDAGSSTVTNTQGSITSTVRANASAGFSIVTYTGNGSSGATVGHGLGVTPQLVIIKSRSLSVEGWNTYHASLTAGYALQLNSTQAQFVGSPTMYPTAPGSSVFTLGTNSGTNSNGATYVAYCFAPVAGYSSFGSYTGNGSTDGPFVFCNFRPRWVILKNASAVWNWQLRDTARDTYNPAQARLFPNTSDAESTNDPVDILANGFKIRVTGGDYNGNGNTFIWAAFAENPFQYARAR